MADLWQNEAIAECHKLASAFMGHIAGFVRGTRPALAVKAMLTTERDRLCFAKDPAVVGKRDLVTIKAEQTLNNPTQLSVNDIKFG